MEAEYENKGLYAAFLFFPPIGHEPTLRHKKWKWAKKTDYTQYCNYTYTVQYVQCSYICNMYSTWNTLQSIQ